MNIEIVEGGSIVVPNKSPFPPDVDLTKLGCQKPKHSEADLNQLYGFIAGRGPWRHFGPGMRTHPEGDAQDRLKHDACLELERRGRIKRKLEESGLVVWEPEGK